MKKLFPFYFLNLAAFGGSVRSELILLDEMSNNINSDLTGDHLWTYDTMVITYEKCSNIWNTKISQDIEEPAALICTYLEATDGSSKVSVFNFWKLQKNLTGAK